MVGSARAVGAAHAARGPAEIVVRSCRAIALGPLIDFEVAAGERVVVLGRNGAGKSTLLRAIAGVCSPAHGTARASGPIAWVPQDPGASLFPWLDAEANIALPLRVRGLARRDIAARISEAMEIVPLDRSALHRRPLALSGGERQLVAIARALAVEPRVLLLDEPFAALDLPTRIAMRRLLRDKVDALRCACVMVTHDLDDAASFGTRVVVIAEPMREIDCSGRSPANIAVEIRKTLVQPACRA